MLKSVVFLENPNTDVTQARAVRRQPRLDLEAVNTVAKVAYLLT